MKASFSTYAMLYLGAHASAAVIPRSSQPCSFSMSVVGNSMNGLLEEDVAGENRLGGTYEQGSYIISNNVLTDAQGHYCLISSEYQFVCSATVPSATKFSLADNGNLQHDGSEDWLACLASDSGDDSSYTIFTTSKPDASGCKQINLRTGGFSCTALGRPDPTNTTSTTPAASTMPSTSLSSLASTSTSTLATISCPTDITSGTYQFPHLIVPLSLEHPDTPIGNSFSAHVSPVNDTLFNFDIPASPQYTGTCALLFLFPTISQLDPSAGAYYFSGTEAEVGTNGGLDFALLAGIANSGTTWNSSPRIATDYGKTQIIPGNSYTVATFPCPAGQTVTYSASSVGHVQLDYFQDSAPHAIGLYMVPCTSS